MDELNELINNSPEIKLHNEYFKEMSNFGTDKGEIPEGTGRFGFDVTNPIPVHGIYGSKYYLGKLLDENGKHIKYNRIGSTSSPNISNLIDIYVIMNNENAEIATLYISPYHKKNSNKAPEGFTLKKDLFELINEQKK